MKLDEIIELEIIDLDYLGFGIGKKDDKTIFVPNALVGEKIKCKITELKKNIGFAELVEIINESKERVKDFCANGELCGGCMLKHLNYDSQIEFKRKLVENTLRKIGDINISLNEVVKMENPNNYRNKIQVPFSEQKYGFYKYNTHDIIETSDCKVQPLVAKNILESIKKIDIKYELDGLKHVLIKYSKNTKQIMVVLITNNLKKLHKAKSILIEELKKFGVTTICINENNKDTNVILGDRTKVIYGDGYITDIMGDLRFKIGVESFYQINTIQAEKLYNEAIKMANLSNNEIAVDCYSGIGTITLFLAKHCKKVYGIEIVEEAVLNARDNAKINNIENSEFLVGKSEDLIDVILKKNKIDVIFVDPPRKGLDQKFIEAIKKYEINKMIYISCNVRSLARDLKELKDLYDIVEVKAFDMFPHTNHVETVCLLEKRTF